MIFGGGGGKGLCDLRTQVDTYVSKRLRDVVIILCIDTE